MENLKGLAVGMNFCKCHRELAKNDLFDILIKGADSVVAAVKRGDIESIAAISEAVRRYEAASDKKVIIENVIDGNNFDAGEVGEKKEEKVSVAEISDRFEYKKPSEEGIRKIETIRKNCQILAMMIDAEIPDSREKDMAIKKLEEVSMWANKAIVFNVK
jgi:hypothetical protein